MTMSRNDQLIRDMEQRLKGTLRSLPRLVGNEVVNFAKDSFRRQGWLGNSFEPWPARKSQSKWGKTPRNKGRALLIDTGRLRRGTRVMNADWSGVRVANDVPYAKAHNEGMRLGIIQTVRAHRRKRQQNSITGARGKRIASGVTFVRSHTRKVNQKLPKRQFLGNSPYLTRNIHRLISSQINKALNR